MSVIVLFDKDFMFDVIDNESNNAELISDEIIDTTRWSIIHRIIFKKDNKYYSTTYSEGATEYQDEAPWEYDDMVECREVEPYEKVIIEYREVK